MSVRESLFPPLHFEGWLVNVGSLFSGIGGMDAGLARAGHRHVFFCEADSYRRDVLAARWPGVPVFDDVRDLHPGDETARSSWRAAGRRALGGEPDLAAADAARSGLGGPSLGCIDLLAGGFPCQDLSVAGQRRGLAGGRSGLFFEFARLIDAFRPGWVLVENVPGLLSSNGGRDFGVVLGTLADLGYGLAWRILDSRFFGVPQRRRRVFIVGAKSVGDPRAAAERAGEVLAVGSRCPGHPATRGEARQDDPGAPVAGTLGGRRGFTGDDIDRGGHTSLSGLGNGGPDDNDAQAGRLVVANTLRSNERNTSQGPGNYVTHALTSEGADASEDSSGRDGGSSRLNQVMVGLAVRRLTPTECERLQGLPDGWTQLGDTPDSRRYSALGDAVTANVAEWLGERLAIAGCEQPLKGDEAAS